MQFVCLGQNMAKVQGRNVHLYGANRPGGESSRGRKDQGANRLWGETSSGRNVQAWGETTRGRNVQVPDGQTDGRADGRICRSMYSACKAIAYAL